MLAFNIDSLFKARGIKRKYYFLKKLGFTHHVAHRLAHGDTGMLKADHVEKICLALHCTPNDLLRWTPDVPVLDDHPMHELDRDHGVDLLTEFNKLPLDKLQEIKRKLDEEAEG